MKTLKDVTWREIAPPAIRNDPQVRAITSAVTPQQQAVSQAISECIILARLNEQPEEVVDLLAWQYHVDFYERGLKLDQKRNLVRTAIDVHRHKGTPYAVETVVKAYLNNAVVREWFDFGGDPYTFRIETSGFNQGENTMSRLVAAINSVKNTRSHLVGVTINISHDAYEDSAQLKIKTGILQCTIGRKRINLPPVPTTNITATTGVVYIRAGRHTIGLMIPPEVKSSLYAGNIIRRTGRITIGGIK